MGGLRLDQAKRLKELERENTRLKKLVADQALDNMNPQKRWPRDTSEPAETPAGGGRGPPPAGRLRAAGLSGAGPGAVHAPASGADGGW